MNSCKELSLMGENSSSDVMLRLHRRPLNESIATIMLRFSCPLLIVFSIISLTGCGSSGDMEHARAGSLSAISPAAGGPLLPLPGEIPVADPDDDVLMAAVSEWLQQEGGSVNSRYEFTRVDLNRDGRREGLVLMQSPHQEWCMEYGCTLFIFQAQEEGFSFLSEISPIRGPMTVAEGSTNGWRDIIAYISGRDLADARNVALAFDGRSYPQQPAFLPAATRAPAENEGVKIFP